MSNKKKRSSYPQDKQVELVDYPSLDYSASPDTKSKRGRPVGSTATFYYWSRVLSLIHGSVDFTQKFDVAEDLEEESKRLEEEKVEEGPVATPIFLPKTFFNTTDKPKLEDYQLSVDQLHE